MPIVEAVGVAVGRNSIGEALHARLERELTEVVRQAQAEGVTDPDEIRARILKARDAILES
jgi:hypothetical protein